MLTLFTTAKPFKGHLSVIQSNALHSWKLLGPAVEIILFGDEWGSADAAIQFNLRHEPEIAQNEHGTTLVNGMFERAQQIAKHNLICYVNCDIVLTSDFCRAAARLVQWQSRFLMIGRRWDVDITEAIDFSDGDWSDRITSCAQTNGYQRAFHNIDYFLFTKGLYKEIPRFAIGRLAWDNWLVWQALELKAAVVDVSAVVYAVHQNHDYSHHALGTRGIFQGEEARRNLQLAGGRKHLRTIEDAPWRLTPKGVVKNHLHFLAPAKRRWRDFYATVGGAWRTYVWHPFLDFTRPLRRHLGLRQSAIPQVPPASKRRHPMDR